jgi:aspartate/methionine/tyrosine aminotransferase
LKRLGFEIPAMPDGAFYFYLDCKNLTDNSATLADKLLNEAYVSMVPGADFGANEPNRYMRLSYATEMSQLKEAVARISKFFALV